MRICVPDKALILLVGLAGSGKSTFARKHFREYEVISSDHCRALVCGDPTDQDATANAFELVHLIADKRLRWDKVAVIDATNLKAVDRAPLIDLAIRHRALRLTIVLNLDTELCWQRNRDRKRLVPREVVDTQARWLATSLTELASEVDELYDLRNPDEVDATVVHRTGAR